MSASHATMTVEINGEVYNQTFKPNNFKWSKKDKNNVFKWKDMLERSGCKVIGVTFHEQEG